MLFDLHSLKGLSRSIETMLTNPRNTLLVSGGITAFVTSGFLIIEKEKTNQVIGPEQERTKQEQERTKQEQERTKQEQERTKQVVGPEQEMIKQEQERTKQHDLQLQIVKAKRWFRF
jgi:hypothetical protein